MLPSLSAKESFGTCRIVRCQTCGCWINYVTGAHSGEDSLLDKNKMIVEADKITTTTWMYKVPFTSIRCLMMIRLHFTTQMFMGDTTYYRSGTMKDLHSQSNAVNPKRKRC